MTEQNKDKVGSIKYTKYLISNIDELNGYLNKGFNHQLIADKFNAKLISENLPANLTKYNISQIISRIRNANIKKSKQLIVEEEMTALIAVVNKEIAPLKIVEKSPLTGVDLALAKQIARSKELGNE